MRSQAILTAVRWTGEYTEAHHRDGVDEHNHGVSHVGILPTTWSN